MENKHKHKKNRSHCFQWEKNTPNINTIKQVTNKRMLGVIIDEKLTFKDHIKYTCMQARKSYSQLAAFPNLPLSTLKTLYKSLIQSNWNIAVQSGDTNYTCITTFKILNLFKGEQYPSF